MFILPSSQKWLPTGLLFATRCSPTSAKRARYTSRSGLRRSGRQRHRRRPARSRRWSPSTSIHGEERLRVQWPAYSEYHVQLGAGVSSARLQGKRRHFATITLGSSFRVAKLALATALRVFPSSCRAKRRRQSRFTMGEPTFTRRWCPALRVTSVAWPRTAGLTAPRLDLPRSRARHPRHQAGLHGPFHRPLHPVHMAGIQGPPRLSRHDLRNHSQKPQGHMQGSQEHAR